MTAQAWITGEAPNQKINLRLPSGGKGKQGDPGPKGEPGGWVATKLNTANLNQLYVTGLYVQESGNYATLDLGYPVSQPGILEVVQRHSTSIFQRYTPTGWVGKGFFERFLEGGTPPTAHPWSFYSSSRVDNTAGRAIYQWDNTAAREQLIYGDTGWRDITPLLGTGWGPANSVPIFQIKREGSVVTLVGRIKVVGVFKTNILALPPGFNSSSYTPLGFSVAGVGASTKWVSLGTPATPGTISLYAYQADLVDGDSLAFEISWSTRQPWPATLPGTAVGTIPYN